MKVVICIEKLEVYNVDARKNSIFREGESYYANIINENYWVVDSLGITADDFLMHFEILDEIVPPKEDNTKGETNKKFIEEEKEFEEFLKVFGLKDAIKNEDKESWFKKLIDYIFV